MDDTPPQPREQGDAGTPGTAGERQAEPASRGPGGRRRRVLIASAAGCAVLGGALTLLPWGRGPDGPSEPEPWERARAAVTAGVPAALPGLEALLEDRERRVR
ncbi:hypothetical protein IGX29_27655, partial [Streptomyces sp. H28]|nr:hypothetical protein [Streptomyces sp. H28]